MVGWCGTGNGFDDTFAQRHAFPPSVTRHETDTEETTARHMPAVSREPPPGRAPTGTFSAGIDELFGLGEKPAADFHIRGKSYRENLSHPATGALRARSTEAGP